jgi:hypothetical protein
VAKHNNFANESTHNSLLSIVLLLLICNAFKSKARVKVDEGLVDPARRSSSNGLPRCLPCDWQNFDIEFLDNGEEGNKIARITCYGRCLQGGLRKVAGLEERRFVIGRREKLRNNARLKLNLV